MITDIFEPNVETSRDEVEYIAEDKGGLLYRILPWLFKNKCKVEEQIDEWMVGITMTMII